jgi:serine/threonine protein phosphatase 1
MITPELAPGRLPAGRRIYAVGDVHGCLRQLRELHAAIAEDLQARPAADPLLIHLGDYVDRGPDSAGVVALLAAAQPAGLPKTLPVINLMGNHENMMLCALDGRPLDAAWQWRRNGGETSLTSWGIPPSSRPGLWSSLLPPDHLAFLRGLRQTHREGSYLFVHAGVNPARALADQTLEDLLWIREPFLSWEGDFGAVVVHGHTPHPDPTVRSNRIGIDTGAVMGGVLTCAVLEDDHVHFMQTKRSSTNG